MAQTSLLLAALGAIALVYAVRFVLRGYAWRARTHRLPGPPHSMLWGHLKAMGEQVSSIPRRVHPHVIPLRIMKKYRLGSFFFLDIWPFGDPLIAVMDPDVSQQMSVEHNSLKHETLGYFLKHLTGGEDLVASNGPEWKKWRSIFNPGFANAHLMSLVPGIVDDGIVYTEILAEHADRGDVFRLEEATTRLTIDVIGKVALDLRFNMQRGDDVCVQALREQVHLLPNDGMYNPLAYLNLWAMYRRRVNDRIMKDYIGKVLDQRFAAKQPGQARSDRKRTILDLALDSYLAGEGEGETKSDGPRPQIDEAFKQGVITQIRIFLFAGHDTTSSTICYALHLLRKHPECLARLRAEHAAVLGPVASTLDAIKRDPYILNKLEFTTAVIKETLRLFPAASAPRKGAPGLFIRDPKTGESYPTDGYMIWLIHFGLHRNPNVWPDPDAFVPARFLPEHVGAIPEGAFRPFEMGLRNCIGQNLAMLESRVVLAMICRRFDFETALDALDAVGRDGSFWAQDPSFRAGRQDLDGEELYQVLIGAAKPREGMPARVRRSQWEAA